MGVEAPSGTVTFLFTDIEGSTRLWETAPEAMTVALERHDTILRSTIEAHGGYVFSTGGDGFAAAFRRAGDAVTAAVAAQQAFAREQWPEATLIRVRMGVHTGEVVERGGDYFGPAVNRAARVMGAAPGGQIVVSGATAELIGGRPGSALVDLGPHRLRGVTEPIRLFGVMDDGLGDFEGHLTTDRGVPGNLPRPLTEMVGRAAELKRLIAELSIRRLVTLIGPGGVGKTRTAIEAAWLATAEFTDGVWLIDLGPVTDPAAVPFTVAATLAAQPRDGLSVEDAIVDLLAGRRALVVIDNCEHLLAAARALVARIVADCPSVTVLATSQEPLGLAGERVHTVGSLNPVLEGVELFCERATAADDAFVCDDEDAVVIGEICSRLDGIPLAIELAAARVRSMTPSDLLARLADHRFTLLKGGPKGGVDRHQTLQASVSWSYELLTDTEQEVFDRVSVFAGGFDLAAATAVCADPDRDIGEDDMADVLRSLVDKSMLIVDRSSRRARYRLLETLRQFGGERLADKNALAVARDRHAAHYLGVADWASAAYAGPRQLDAVRAGDREWDNFRAAFDWAHTSGQLEQAIVLALACARLAEPLLRFEHGHWVDALIAEVPRDHPVRSCLYAAAATWAVLSGDQHEATRLARLGIDAVGGCSDPFGPMQCRLVLAMVETWSARPQAALTALATAEPFIGDDRYRLATWLQVAAMVAQGDDPNSIPGYHARYRELAAVSGAPLWISIASSLTGMTHLFNGEHQEALRAFQEGLRLCEDTHTMARFLALAGSAMAATNVDDDDAKSIVREAFHELAAANDWLGIWSVVNNLTVHWVLTGALERGAVGIGYLGTHPHARFASSRAEADAILGAHPETAGAQARGAAMTRDQLVTYIAAQLGASKRSDAHIDGASDETSPRVTGASPADRA